MDEKLITTINKIKLFAEQNPEFNQAMQKLFGNETSASGRFAPWKTSQRICHAGRPEIYS